MQRTSEEERRDAEEYYSAHPFRDDEDSRVPVEQNEHPGCDQDEGANPLVKYLWVLQV